MIHNINRSPDATDAGTEVDPLAQAAAGWEGRKFPVLAPDRICEFKITSAKRTTSAQKKLPMAEVVFATTQDYTDRDGGTLRAGYKVYNRIILEAIPGKEGKKGRTWDQVKDDILELLTWCGIRDRQARDFANDPSFVEGYVGMAKVGVREETAEFAASNVLRLVLPA